MLPAHGGRGRKQEEEEAQAEGFSDLSSLEQAFARACGLAAQEDGPISFANNSDKLKLYAFYKQATIGPNMDQQPQGQSFARIAKWEAWRAAGSTSRVVSMSQYVSMVRSFEGGGEGGAGEGARGGQLGEMRKRWQVQQDHMGQARSASTSAASELGEAAQEQAGELRGGSSEIVYAPAAEDSGRGAGGANAWDESDGGGGERDGGLHLFFIWVNPSEPCSRDDGAWPLPEKYERNVRDWEARYGRRAALYGGQACYEFVRGVDADAEADCGGLLAVYEALAAQGNWIKMVDIARVCVMWARGGMYLDTDMEIGPRTFAEAEMRDARCWLVEDEEGVIQNHFFRAPPRHAFIRFLLHVLRCNALAEAHVVQATGPCAVTAAHGMYSGTREGSASLLLVATPAAEAEAEGGEAERDLFAAAEVDALCFRIRSRLIGQGYGDPVGKYSSPMPGEVEGRLRTRAGGAFRATLGTEVSLYPPSAFYVYHWREASDGRAALRSRDLCFAVHTWDTTWAGGPGPALKGRGYLWYGGGYGSYRPTLPSAQPSEPLPEDGAEGDAAEEEGRSAEDEWSGWQGKLNEIEEESETELAGHDGDGERAAAGAATSAVAAGRGWVTVESGYRSSPPEMRPSAGGQVLRSHDPSRETSRAVSPEADRVRDDEEEEAEDGWLNISEFQLQMLVEATQRFTSS